MRKLYVVTLLSMFFGAGLFAQDIHFSQFYQAPLHLNPAMTGVMECTQRFSANYRNQWSSVISNEFQTYSASYDMKIPAAQYDYFGAGISLWGDQAGSGRFATYQARLSGSYSRYMGGSRTSSNYLVVGADLALSSRSLNIAKLQWGTQHDGQGGFDPTALSGEDFADDQFLYPDASVGLLWFSRLDDNLNFYIGGAAAHINRPKQSFFNDNQVKLYTKYTIHAGGEIGLNENVSFLPGAVAFFQGPSFQLNAGTSVRFYLNGSSYSSESFQIGAWTRLVNNYEFGFNQMTMTGTDESSLGADAMIISARFDYDNYGIGFSYDVNVSDLRTASNSKGSFEFSLVYNICGNESRRVYCPKF